MRLGGQVRTISTMNGYVVLGWDMGAALKLADNLDANPYLAALILPEIEQIACAKINERLQADG
ncbi:hypothetical protein PsAD13_01406 [Pseudovibrio sp. Ad13]|uniref:DUF7697 family protein n=1 Tax=unclassified Pseudovibrio TaxID=2627060 RepID=UPI0007AEA967|nr:MULTISPECIES: hypothetical protein [unclassified Pseudovibrio]KZK84873.1 hypothetical protein PsAD13_01406 [Pseudovibrio sp. Ad13]KZL21962.1 hypothetical protein PsAD37_03482 [Pseudovibrio sp. Ad37]